MWDYYKVLQLKNACKKDKLPSFICEYLHLFPPKHTRADLWSNLRFVVLDTETTGLNSQADNILSLGAIAIQNEEIYLKDSLELVINSNVSLKSANVAVHGLIQSDLAHGIDEIEALEHFMQFIRGDIIVAHHARFDVSMLEKHLKRFHSSFFLQNITVDTAFLAFTLERPDLPLEFLNPQHYSLDALCDRYHISPVNRHTSWGDAMITAELLLKFFSMLRKQGKLSLKHLLL